MPVSLNQILEMPHAAILAERVQSVLKREQSERERFYKVVDENKTAEFINGKIVVHLPSCLEEVSASGALLMLLDTHVEKNQLGFVGHSSLLTSFSRNDYMPDVCFFGRAKADQFKTGQMQFPAPDLAIEVLSDSTAKHDRETKFQDYAAHGVKEYWIIDPKKETVEQYVLQNEQYELFLKSGSGEIKSVAVENFTIQIRAVFNKQANLEELRRLI